MPFENLGAGPEREYLADGFTEETIVRFLALLRRCGFTQPGETLTRRGYRFIVEPLLATRPPESPVRALSRSLEQMVRRCPEQYLWSYNRYKVPAGARPPGGR